jgi:hypothetical protein
MENKEQKINIETYIITNGKAGEHFYSDKTDGHLTAIASNVSRKITTQRLIAVTTAKSNPEAKYITKVTLL